MGSTVVLGALSYLAFRGPAAMALAIGSPRLRNWMSDVLAGVSGGAMWVGVTTVAHEALRRIRILGIRQPVKSEGSPVT